MCKFFKLSYLPTSKILMFIFNILLFIIGASYLGIGSYLINSLLSKPDVDGIKYCYRLMGALMLTAGLVGILLSFYGFFLSFSRSTLLLSVYLILIVLLLLYGIAVGIVGLINADLAPDIIKSALNKNAFFSINSGNINLANDVQSKYQCCGLNAPDDWNIVTASVIPQSCCIGTTQLNCVGGTYYTSGCLSTVSNSIKNDIAITGGIALGIALPIILGILLTVGLIIELMDKSKPLIYKAPKSF